MGKKISIPHFGHDNGQPFRARVASSRYYDSCAWCGRKLKACPWQDHPTEATEYGGYGDGYFCGLRCGYRFAVTFAENGHWLQAISGDPPVVDGMATLSTTEAWEGRDT